MRVSDKRDNLNDPNINYKAINDLLLSRDKENILIAFFMLIGVLTEVEPAFDYIFEITYRRKKRRSYFILPFYGELVLRKDRIEGVMGIESSKKWAQCYDKEVPPISMLLKKPRKIVKGKNVYPKQPKILCRSAVYDISCIIARNWFIFDKPGLMDVLGNAGVKIM